MRWGRVAGGAAAWQVVSLERPVGSTQPLLFTAQRGGFSSSFACADCCANPGVRLLLPGFPGRCAVAPIAC